MIVLSEKSRRDLLCIYLQQLYMRTKIILEIAPSNFPWENRQTNISTQFNLSFSPWYNNKIGRNSCSVNVNKWGEKWQRSFWIFVPFLFIDGKWTIRRKSDTCCAIRVYNLKHTIRPCAPKKQQLQTKQCHLSKGRATCRDETRIIWPEFVWCLWWWSLV